MTSFIWNREPEEAYQNPYEYDAQEQFDREALSMLNGIYNLFLDDKFLYKKDDISIERAIYMLHLDSIESLKECLELLKEKRHSVAARLLRDVFENVLLCNYFWNDNRNEKHKNLRKWYKNEVIMNSICRNSIESRMGSDVKKHYKDLYNQLSKITHRTYRTLAYSYSLGAGETFRYEGRATGKFLVLAHTISMYYAVLSQMIEFTLNEIASNEIFKEESIEDIKNKSYEVEMVKRRF